MKGLVIWAQFPCRSTAGLYRAIRQISDVPVKVTLFYSDCRARNLRAEIGLRSDEFDDEEMIPIGDDYNRALHFLDSVPGYYHVFCIWQQAAAYRRLMREIRRRGGRYAVACEAPCNMKTGCRAILQEIYYSTGLPLKGRSVIKGADFFLNFSGVDDAVARRIGWPKDKIVPFGYFSPPLEGSHFVRRGFGEPFLILCSGALARFRGPDILMRAAIELKRRGVPFRMVMTQTGELLSMLKEMAKTNDLPVEFPGLLPMSDLIRIYETCSVYVGAGRHEPWGMRLNDALHCGAPLIVSRGMGGVKLVDDYGCGLSFRSEDAIDLADKLQTMATDRFVYETCAANVVTAAAQIAPETQARKFLLCCRTHDLQRGRL